LDEHRYSVCLSGASLDAGNKGVGALGASFLNLALRARPGARLWLLAATRSHEDQTLATPDGPVRVQVANYRLSPKAPPSEQVVCILAAIALYRLAPIERLRRRLRAWSRWIGALAEADFVGDICGGDSFSDIYGLRRFFPRIFPSLSALLMGKRLVLLPQTYGPYRSAVAKALARFIMRRAWRLYARDETSLQLARAMLGGGPRGAKAQFCPDVAFTLMATALPAMEITPPEPKPDSGVPLVGLNVSGLLYRGGYGGKNMFGLRCDYKAFVHALVGRLMTETDARVLIVPHEFGRLPENDPGACREVWEAARSKHGARVHLVAREYAAHELKGLIGRCDFFIGSRMHSCIAALSQGVPCVGVAYSRKFKGVFESVGAGEMVADPREQSLDEMLESCLARYRSRGAAAAALAIQAPKTRAQVCDLLGESLRDGSRPTDVA
jgi:polysaccharide pyruvyl transferase WcaK-like protein